MARHCSHILRLGTAGILGGWALQGYLVARRCRDTWWLDTAGIFCAWALQGYLVARHCRDTWWLGTAGTLCGCALQGHLVIGRCGDAGCGHSRDALLWALQSGSGRRARTTWTLKSNNPAARVGNKARTQHIFEKPPYSLNPKLRSVVDIGYMRGALETLKKVPEETSTKRLQIHTSNLQT